MRFLFMVLLGLALAGCLATGDMMKNIAISTKPSPMYLSVENSLPVGVITVTNNNPFDVRIQCFPPQGPTEGYFQESETGIVNKTLFTRPAISCYDGDEIGNSSRAGYPTVRVKAHGSHAFVVEAVRYGEVHTRSNEIFSTTPGVYALDLRLDVWCYEPGCSTDPQSIAVPMQVNIPQVKQ